MRVGREQRFAERHARRERRGIAPVETRLLDHAAHERETVGVHAGGGQREDNVARFDVLARQQRLALDRAHGEAREIVVARRIDPRHLGGLAADQRRAGLLAAFGDAADHRLRHARLELAGGEIVEEEQRLSALHDDVVDVHGDEIDADPVMDAGLDGELELGADAVGGGDEHGVLEAASLEVEQATEAADAAEQACALRLCGQRPDGLDQRVACVDIDARVAIGQSRLVLGGGGHRTAQGAEAGDLA